MSMKTQQEQQRQEMCVCDLITHVFTISHSTEEEEEEEEEEEKFLISVG